MKAHQFEEITAALSIIITLMAYEFEINWLFYIYFIKSCIDTIAALIKSFKAAKLRTNKSQKP